jgi:acyl-coenzyme A thioesterase PaaI-like protein
MMVAEATVVEEINNKRVVSVEVKVEEKPVLNGELTCFVMEKHVLTK